MVQMDVDVEESHDNNLDITFTFPTEHCNEYYKKEINKHGLGGRYLVAQSFYHGKSIKPEDIQDEDLNICLQMTILVHSLSTRQNKLLGNFLDLLFKKIDHITNSIQKFKNHYDSLNEINCKPTIPTMPPIPTNYQSLRSGFSRS